MDANVSRVAAYPAVRTALLDLQRKIANGNEVVMVGRDIGTVVTPKAGTKIYLDASVEERARRRYHDIRKLGEDLDYAEFVRIAAEYMARNAPPGADLRWVR